MKTDKVENFVTIYDSPSVLAGYSCRGELTSDAGSYEGFSLCHYVGDDPGHVSACRVELARELGVKPSLVLAPRQVHGTAVKIVDESCCDYGTIAKVEADALVTDLTGVAIGVNTADCVPVLLCDEEAGIVAAAHAGWRGAVAGILDATVEKMARIGAVCQRIHAFICPAICVSCFEVGEEVASQFPQSCVVRMLGSKPHVNLPECVAICLERCGISRDNISFSGECTRCRPSRYFSARAMGVASGRNFSYIMLKAWK